MKNAGRRCDEISRREKRRAGRPWAGWKMREASVGLRRARRTTVRGVGGRINTHLCDSPGAGPDAFLVVSGKHLESFEKQQGFSHGADFALLLQP